MEGSANSLRLNRAPLYSCPPILILRERTMMTITTEKRKLWDSEIVPSQLYDQEHLGPSSWNAYVRHLRTDFFPKTRTTIWSARWSEYWQFSHATQEKHMEQIVPISIPTRWSAVFWKENSLDKAHPIKHIWRHSWVSEKTWDDSFVAAVGKWDDESFGGFENPRTLLWMTRTPCGFSSGEVFMIFMVIPRVMIETWLRIKRERELCDHFHP